MTHLAKYPIIAPVAFAITLGLYEFGVRWIGVVRFLFGMRPSAGGASGAPPALAGQGV